MLGLIIDGTGVRMTEEKIEKIMNFSIPKTKKELQRFLGTLNYHRRFIDDYNEKTKFLFEILKDEKTMADWTENHTKLFKNVQNEANKKLKDFIQIKTKC